MDRIKKARTPNRKSVTTTVNEVVAELAKENPDKLYLRVRLEKLHELSETLQAQDEAVLDFLLDADAAQDVYDAEAAAVEEYQDKIRACRVSLDKALSAERPDSPAGSAYSTATEKKRQYKLPKITPRTFDGDVKNWLSFWSQFQKIHDDEELHDSDKFQYLVQSMEDGTRAKKLVDSYPQTSENYAKVVEALTDRYGDKTLLAEVYVRELLKFVNTNLGKTASLFSIYDELESHLRSLETLGVTAKQSAIFLYPMVESSLPLEIIKVWQRSSLSGYGEEEEVGVAASDRLEKLMKFLRQEVKGEERLSYVTEGVSQDKSKKKWNLKEKVAREKDEVPTVAGLFVSDKPKCCFCENGHESRDCRKAQGMTLEQRNSAVRDKKRCFVCLRTGHSSKFCKSPFKCPICGRRHALLLCQELTSQKKQAEKSEQSMSNDAVSNVTSNLACSAETVLKTMMVTVIGTKGKKIIRAILDDGSQRSYISNDVAEEVGLPVLGHERIQHTLFGGVQTSTSTYVRSLATLCKPDGTGRCELEVLGKEEICGQLPRVPKGSWMKRLKQKHIFITDVGDGAPKIDLLVGAKDLAKLLTSRMETITEGLVAIETTLGWTLMGESPAKCKSLLSNVVAMNVTCMQVAESSVEQLWNLETIGIRDPAEKKSKDEKEEAVRQHFLKTVTRSEDGRYKVSLPWIDGRQELPDNRLTAEKRLVSTTRKLLSLEKYEDYEEVFTRWLEEGIIEEVPEDEIHKPAHYLPHHAVLKPQSLTTPLRPVFNASSKDGRNPSLNECLEKGPNLLDLLPDILLRFRIGSVGVISDIRKAFLMIDLAEEDRDYMRFLWWKDKETKEYRVFRHKRVVFGVNCSPFLLGAVIEYHLQQANDEDKEAAALLLKALYVDNCILSLNSMEEYEDFRERATRLMEKAKMELRLWQCCSGEESGVGSLISRDRGLETDRTSAAKESQETSVLGMLLNTVEDTLRVEIDSAESSGKVTKRQILSAVHRVFDPIGIVSPALLPPKLLLQESWSLKTKWDEELSEEYQTRFGKWIADLEKLKDIRIPRNATGYVRTTDKWQFHMYCDASKYAYAACVFLRTEGIQGVSCQLLRAKSRVAPVKPMTIPRLELLACTIGARLMDSVKRALSAEEVPTFYWSDSSTALAWIKGNDEWGTFVGNRVREILSLTEPADWRHVPGKFNPADLPSRGCSASELLSSRWWEGPDWLRLPPTDWPSEAVAVSEEEVLAERKKSVKVLLAKVNEDPIPWYAPTSSHYNNLRILALVRRFIDRCRGKAQRGSIDVDECDTSEKIIVRLIQQESFPQDSTRISGLLTELDEDGLRRVQTKLLHRDDSLDFKRPLLLPHQHLVVDQIIMEEHISNCHAGVQFVLGRIRERYWIVQGRKAVRRIITKCVICRRFSAKRPEVIPSSLPKSRVSSGRVFETVGVDLAGPLFIKKKKKAWIVLITCAVYRCVHLEMVKSLSTEAFLEAFNRFLNRRGRPEKVYSDNGTNFTGSNNLFAQIDWERVTRECGLRRIRWIFNPPSAAWWGGFWERLIGSTKDLLRRVLGRSSLTFDKLRNYLCDVEAVINGRPLTIITEDPEDLRPLTPAMFLHEMPCPAVSDLELLDASGFQQIFVERKRISDELKMRFRREYLAQLVQRGKETGGSTLKVGDVVLVGADNRKRWEWPMAKVLQLYPGKDGHVRVAQVKTATGVLTRPVQRLYPMEVSSPSLLRIETTPEEDIVDDKVNSEPEEDVVASGKKEVTLRSGRVVKVPLKY